MRGRVLGAARVRACLAIGASVAALAVSQNAAAQACGDGSAGPVCTIYNNGSIGPIVGAPGTVTIVENEGTVTGAPAINLGNSAALYVDNLETGVITGTNGLAITAVPRMAFGVVNDGTINGNVVYNDAPAPNVFAGPLAYYASTGGTLNGNLQLGTTGFSSATFLFRGPDDGVTGTISAGAGLDVYSKIYDASQDLTLGQYVLPATFEVEGYYANGTDTVLTLGGTSTSIQLGGEGHVILNGQVNTLDATPHFPAGTTVIPAAISYFQPYNATFRRWQIPAGQPGSFFAVPNGNALASFTNNGVVNGEVNLATASFVNTGNLNFNSRSLGSTIFNAANTAFVFDNQNSIVLNLNGDRLPGLAVLGEFEDGLNAALRLRSAVNTTEASEVTIKNSGLIVGGLDVKMAATDFVFENSGSIEGVDIPGGYYTPGLRLGVGELDLVAGVDPETHFDAATATILNSASGSIDHNFGAFLSAFEVSFTNHGFIAGSDVNPNAIYIEQYLDADDVDATSLTFVNTGQLEGNLELEAATTTVSISNSGTIAGGGLALNQTTFPELMFGGPAAVDIGNESMGDNTFTFVNSGTITNLGRGGSGVAIEIEAGDDDGEILIGNSNVSVVNSGTIQATGGATIVTQQFANWLNPGQFLVNSIAALAVDASDVNGESAVSITNAQGGSIIAGGNIGVVTPNGYFDVANSANNATVAVFASGKVIDITNAGLIQGGAGTFVSPNAVPTRGETQDGYLAGAIQTEGDEYGPDDALVYVGSLDIVTNTATGTIIGSIDLGANNDTLNNAGTITGDIYLRDGVDALLNYGTLTGNLYFGAGDDSFTQGVSAIFTGTADGGEGSDSFFLDLSTGGAIDQTIYDRLVNFELFSLIGSGEVDVTLGDTDDSFENSGTLTGEVDLGAGSNSFANQGTIEGNVTSGSGDDAVANNGTVVGNVSLGDGTNQFSNTGEVSGNVTGGSGSDQVANDGTVNGTVDLGDGSNTFANTGNVNGDVTGGSGADQVVNSGVVTGTVALGDGSNTFANTGEVVGDVTGGSGADQVTNTGDVTGSIALGDGTNSLTNTGSVTGDVSGGDNADSIQNGGSIMGDVYLDTLAAQPAGLFTGLTLHSITTQSSHTGGNDTFTNTGTLSGDVNAGAGDDSVSNSGTISGSVIAGDGNDTVNNSGTIGGSIFGGDGADTVTNSGTVTGGIDLGAGNDTLALTGAWSVGGTITGGTGTDTLGLTLTGTATNVPTLNLARFTAFETLNLGGGTGKIGGTATFGQINLASGRLIGDFGSNIVANVAVASGATFGSAGTVTGNIAVASGGTLSPGASPAVMNVTGNVSLATGSNTLFEFVPAPGQSDQLLINGNLTIAQGAVLNITGSRPLTPGVAYDMIVANTITGTFTIGTWDKNAVQGFLRYLDGATTDRLQLLGTFVAQGTVSPQADAAIEYVNNLLVAGGASTALMGSITSLLDTSGFASAQAFSLLTPEPYASATQLAVENGLSLAKVSRSGLAEVEGDVAGLFGFGTAYGNWRSLDADTALGTSQAKNRDYGVLGGIGFGNATASVGAFVGYTESRQRIAALGAQTDADGITFGLAGHYGAGALNIDGLAGYTSADAETVRAVPGAVAGAEYDLNSIVLDAAATYDMPMGGVMVTPGVGLTHVSARRGAATESGSAAFGLDVDRDRHSASFVDGSIAVSGLAGSVRPWAEVGVRYQFEGELVGASAGLLGSATRFTVPGAPRDETVLTAGAGVEASMGDNVNLFATYRGEFGGGTGSTAAIGVKARF